MKKIRTIRAMRARENLSRQKASGVLSRLSEELNKCRNVAEDLKKLADEKTSLSGEVSGYAFQSDRHLIMKLMSQKEIMNNRQDFLTVEMDNMSKNLSEIQSKIQLLEKKEKEEYLEQNKMRDQKFDDELQVYRKR
jgi:flagellar biosynthesis chaperone FliJ